MDSYKVTGYRAYGTSAIRETRNTGIVLDQIRQRTGIKLEVLSNSEQRFLDYKAVAFRGETSVLNEVCPNSFGTSLALLRFATERERPAHGICPHCPRPPPQPHYLPCPNK